VVDDPGSFSFVPGNGIETLEDVLAFAKEHRSIGGHEGARRVQRDGCAQDGPAGRVIAVSDTAMGR
jgi:hypothetical protein